MPRPKKVSTTTNYIEKIEAEVQSNQSRLSLVLGALIVIVIGVLVFNYFNKNKAQLGPAQNTQSQEDVKPENLPGKYTVKDGDTLFVIAQKYYNDGFKFTEIAKANNLSSADTIETNQVLDIPKLDQPQVSMSPAPTDTPTVTPETISPTLSPTPSPTSVDQNDWGSAITGSTYTVVEGDWLSTIAARAYKGDVLAYQKLAAANNISNPNYIIPGMVLNIPR